LSGIGRDAAETRHSTRYLPDFLCGGNVAKGRDRASSIDFGAMDRLKAKRPRRQRRPDRIFTECRAYYSQEYRLNMLRRALRDAMHR